MSNVGGTIVQGMSLVYHHCLCFSDVFVPILVAAVCLSVVVVFAVIAYRKLSCRYCVVSFVCSVAISVVFLIF